MHAVTIRTALLQSHNIQLDEHCFYVDAQYVLRPVPYIETVVFLPGDSISISTGNRWSEYEFREYAEELFAA